MEKTCSTCLFAARKITSFPCSVCIDNGRWQPNEETPTPITYTREEVLDKFSDIYLTQQTMFTEDEIRKAYKNYDGSEGWFECADFLIKELKQNKSK